jgi:MFS family permease
MNISNSKAHESDAFVEEHPGIIASLRALPRAAWILFLGIFLNRFGTFVIPFLTLYMKGKGYGVGDAGIAIGSYGLGTLLASFLGGYLADRIGRRKTIAISMFGGAASMLVLSRAESWWGIVLLTGLNGLCGEFYRPASTALLADVVPAGQRVIAFSTYRMALNAGWAFGPATGGFLTHLSYKWLFLGDAFTSLLFGLVAWTALPEGRRSSHEQAGWSVALRQMGKDRLCLQYFAASFFIALIFFQISSTYGLFVTQLGFTPAVYGALISLNGLLVACFELVVSNISRRFPARHSIAFGYIMVGVGFGLNAGATALPVLVLAIVLFTLGEMISIPVGAAYLADLAPAEMRGRYMGAQGLTWGVALIFGPGLGMYLLERGSTLLWLACGASGLIGAVIIQWPRKTNSLSALAGNPENKLRA